MDHQTSEDQDGQALSRRAKCAARQITAVHSVQAQDSGIASALFGATFLGEHLSLPNWAGVALIAVGTVLVAYKG